MASLEQSLVRTEADAEATLKAATTVVSSVKKFRDAAKKGNLRELHKTLDAAEQAIAALKQQFSNAQAGWDFELLHIGPFKPVSRKPRTYHSPSDGQAVKKAATNLKEIIYCLDACNG